MLNVSNTYNASNAKPEQNYQIPVTCPNGEGQAQKTIHKFSIIPKGRAGWWYCSSCQNWHVYLPQN